MLRLGLVSKFILRPIKFRSATATSLLKLERREALATLSRRSLENALALHEALKYCAGNNIGAFRIGSGLLPLKTHPQAGYAIEELPEADVILERFKACRHFADAHRLRLSFHPGQFTLLSSPDAGVTRRSLEDLEYHAEVAGWLGADVINIHGGGAYGDKEAALTRVATHLGYLSEQARTRLTLENDDRVYTPADLLWLCHRERVPFVYDVHHHRLLADGQTVEQVTREALTTWEREPLFHISSPRFGWKAANGITNRRPHHDYVNPTDFPECWKQLASVDNLTVEVEAKAKELAVLALWHSLKRQGVNLFARSQEWI